MKQEGTISWHNYIYSAWHQLNGLLKLTPYCFHNMYMSWNTKWSHYKHSISNWNGENVFLYRNTWAYCVPYFLFLQQTIIDISINFSLFYLSVHQQFFILTLLVTGCKLYINNIGVQKCLSHALHRYT